MDEIGSAGLGERWRGYVAVICADGNGIGRRFTAVRTPLELKTESERVCSAVDRAVDEGLRRAVEDFRHLASGAAPGDLPVNPLVKAGDDIRMIVPAAVGLSAAVGLTLGGDPAAANDAQPVPGREAGGVRPFRACAGVVVCHHDLPFNVAHEHAVDLLAAAKRSSRAESVQDPPSHVAFSIETGSQVQRGSRVVSASPYRSDHVGALLDAANRLEVSDAALRNAVEGVGQGGRLAERAWLRFRQDLGKDARKVLDGLWGRLGMSYAYPGRSEEGPERSPLGDLALWRSIRRRAS